LRRSCDAHLGLPRLPTTASSKTRTAVRHAFTALRSVLNALRQRILVL
jgi:hypothetical protein